MVPYVVPYAPWKKNTAEAHEFCGARAAISEVSFHGHCSGGVTMVTKFILKLEFKPWHA